MKNKKTIPVILLLIGLMLLLTAFTRKKNAYVQISPILKPPTLDQGNSWFQFGNDIFDNILNKIKQSPLQDHLNNPLQNYQYNNGNEYNNNNAA